MSSKHRLIAINLPQFHPFKENEEWWGKGFTEWTNVVKARPRFKNHYQPHLPTDTGYYDLRLPDARRMQSEMAIEAGIYGFCYYHYWFNGHRLMERPVSEMISSGEPDFPFMLCWANENWSRNWDGGYKKILIEQQYSAEDDINHMRFLCENVFVDNRYIRVDGKPFFVVYNPELIPDLSSTVQRWRSVASSYNIELYIGYMRQRERTNEELLASGFDVHVDFQPFFKETHPLDYFQGPLAKIKYKIFNAISRSLFKKDYHGEACLCDYQEYIDSQMKQERPAYKEYPCVTPGWDNSPRRVGQKFWAMINTSPEKYEKWLSDVLKSFKPYSEEEDFVFINAWNEWAEGNHLEPDIRFGRAFLDSTRHAIEADCE